MEEKLLTVAEIAEILHVNTTFVYNLRMKGYLKMMKLGQWKCRRATLDEFIVWAENKDFTDMDNVRDLTTGEIVNTTTTAV